MSKARCGAVLAVLLSLALAGCGTSEDASVRLLNASTGYSALDMYFEQGGTFGNPQISDVASGTVSSYAHIVPKSYTVYFTSHGVAPANALLSTSQAFSTNQTLTYVAYGDSGEFAEMAIGEDQPAPSGGYTNVQVLNADPDAGSLDVYLTSPGLSLNDASPNFSAVKGGQSTGFAEIKAGTYELRITGAGEKSDLRFELSSISLGNLKTLSLIITETPGGYLVNVMALPQKGPLTTYSNPDARVRAVIGLNGSVSASMGSTPLVSAAPEGVIGPYELVPAGSDPVTLTVNGASISVPSQTLSPGQDYTFLVYGTAAAVQESLLADSNIPPLSGYSSVRLVNAMSGTTDPISLSIDFLPVATDIPPGSDVPSGSSSGTSPYDTQVTATSTGTVIVTDDTTGQTLYSKPNAADTNYATLASGDVYTMFMFGTTSAPNGELFQDDPVP
jgi:hypothetical protein